MAGQHHLVSEFYLSAFSDSGAADGNLYVLDSHAARSWVTTAAKAARERDFCKIEVPGLDPDAVDHALGKFESAAAPIIKQLRSDPRFHSEHDLEMVLNFMALHVVRERAFREMVTAKIESDLKRRLQEGTATKENWDSDLEAMRKTGVEMPPTCTWESMHKFAREGQYSIEPSSNVHVQVMLDSIDSVLPKLYARDWCVHAVQSGGPDIICSDRPVTLMPRSPLLVGTPIGFGSPNVDVVFPISKRVLMHGAYGECDLPTSMERRDVALVNAALVGFSERFVYSGEAAFTLLHPEGSIVDGRDLLSHLREHQDQCGESSGEVS